MQESAIFSAEQVLSGWAGRYVHALGLCSPWCHGRRSGRDAPYLPPPDDLLFLDLGCCWAGRALKADGVAVGLRRVGRQVCSFCIDLDTGRWASRHEWFV